MNRTESWWRGKDRILVVRINRTGNLLARIGPNPGGEDEQDRILVVRMNRMISWW
jgi:hypothetical protein